MNELNSMEEKELYELFSICDALYREYTNNYIVTLGKDGEIPTNAMPILERRQKLLTLKTCVANLLCDKLLSKYEIN